MTDDPLAVLAEHLGASIDADGYGADPIDEIPGGWFVGAVHGGRPLIGGSAYIVVPATGEVAEVSASQPPFLSIREFIAARGAR